MNTVLSWYTFQLHYQISSWKSVFPHSKLQYKGWLIHDWNIIGNRLTTVKERWYWEVDFLYVTYADLIAHLVWSYLKLLEMCYKFHGRHGYNRWNSSYKSHFYIRHLGTTQCALHPSWTLYLHHINYRFVCVFRQPILVQGTVIHHHNRSSRKDIDKCEILNYHSHPHKLLISTTKEIGKKKHPLQMKGRGVILKFQV